MNTQTIEAARNALRNAPKGVYTRASRPIPKEPIQIFCSRGEYSLSNSFRDCKNAGYQALFVPELALARIEAENDSDVLTKWYTTPSLRVTGTTKRGSKVVLYIHQPTDFSKSANIRRIVKNKNLVNGAGVISQDEFYGFVDLEGNGRIFLADYDVLRKSPEGDIKIDDALSHPQTFPFLGLGERDTKKYLIKCKEVYGEFIRIRNPNDLNINGPVGRFLHLGDAYCGLSVSDIGGSRHNVFGVAPEAQSVAKSLEDKVER